MPRKRTITNARALVERHEGRRRRVYTDSVGKLTVGVGRNISDVPFTGDEIGLMLDTDLERARWACVRMFPLLGNLGPVRVAVLVDMMFNLGPRRLRTFKKMRAALKARDFELAAVEMLDSKWAGQVGKKPRQRAWRLARMMRLNVWVD